MKVVLAMVLAGLVALPLGASAQGGEESTEPNVEEPAPSAEPAPEQPPPSPEPTAEEPALQLELDAAGVEVTPIPPRTPDGYTLEEMNVRVRRARIGFGASAGVYGAGAVLLIVAAAAGLATWEPLGGPPTSGGRYTTNDRALIAGAVLASSGLVGMITAGGIMAHRRRDRRKLASNRTGVSTSRRAPFRTGRELQLRYHEAVDVDTSDDAFLVIVTRKYEGGQLMGATAFIKHKDSGQYANPYIHAAEMDSLDQVIREHKAKLLSGE